MSSVIEVDWGGSSSRQDGWSGGHDGRARGLFIAEERVGGDAGRVHGGAIRKTETVVLVEREAERKVGSRGCRLVGCRRSLVCQCDDAGCVLT